MLDNLMYQAVQKLEVDSSEESAKIKQDMLSKVREYIKQTKKYGKGKKDEISFNPQ